MKQEKEDLFDQWFRSKKLEKAFSKLRQVILLEEFKDCVPQDLKRAFRRLLRGQQSYRILSLFLIKQLFSQELKITIMIKLQTLITKVF